MRARIESQVLYLHHDDTPHYKKAGSVVRNTYFWALKAIADRADFNRDWEYDESVWVALQRVLLSFSESGYLGLKETILEFPPDFGEIPSVFRAIATWAEPDVEAAEAEPADAPGEDESDPMTGRSPAAPWKKSRWPSRRPFRSSSY